MLIPDAPGSSVVNGSGPGAESPPPPPSHRVNGSITAIDRLRSIYRAPGPYASVYLTTEDGADPLMDRWPRHRSALAAAGASEASLQAIEARLTLPAPADTAAVAVLAGADGTTVVDHGEEPPLRDLTVVDTLPYVAPLLEWQQRRVPHLVVTVDRAGVDVASFLPDHQVVLEVLDTDDGSWTDHTAASEVARRAGDIDARLVVVAGDGALTARFGDALAAVLPVECRMVTVPGTDPDALADTTVRQVSDVAARATVTYLRERRFLASHDAAVDGTEATVSALRTGDADVLLIHDDPDDQRRIWFGSHPHDLSLRDAPDLAEGRLVDAAIRSAVLQGTTVHIIPSTGETGPEDGAAALSHQPALTD